MTTVALLALLLASGEQRVLVTAYQGAGRSPEQVARLGEALQAAVAARGWTTVAPAEAERQARAAAMCGEDVPCLATIGTRVETRWVLAFAVGAVGTRTLVSALLVDARSELKVQQVAETLPRFPDELKPLAVRLVDALFAGVSREDTTTPEPAPPPPRVELVPRRPLRSAGIALAIGASVLAVAGGALTVSSGVHFEGLVTVPREARAGADATQRALNLSADVVMIAAGVSAAVAVVLYLIDAFQRPPEARP